MQDLEIELVGPPLVVCKASGRLLVSAAQDRASAFTIHHRRAPFARGSVAAIRPELALAGSDCL